MNINERSRSRVICKNMQERANFLVVNVRGSIKENDIIPLMVHIYKKN